MTRRSSVLPAVLLVALPVVALLAIPVGRADASPNVVGSGTTTCGGSWTAATVSFSPRLTNNGTATREQVFFKATIHPCSGGIPQPTSGVLTGQGTYNAVGANKCANVFPAAPPGGTHTFGLSLVETIRWTPSSLNPTSVHFGAFNVTTTTAGAPVSFSSTGGLVPAGSSYPTTTAHQTFKTLKTDAAIRSNMSFDCGGSIGLSLLVIQASGSTGTF